jgi:hypothetical protein
MKLGHLICLAVFTLLFIPTRAEAQDTEELAKAAQNPVGDLISLPVQNNTSFGLGPDNRTQNVMNVQPVYPIGAGKWNIITRTIFPIITQPDFSTSSGSTTGLGDINFTAFISPAAPGKWIWGAGPVLLFPTASDDNLGTGKWGVGPSFVVLTMSGPWVYGVLANNIWSVAGDEERGDVNSFLAQYFVNYNMANGWYLVSAPIITANWEADSEDRWIVPFGAGAGKIFKIGSQAFNANLQGFVNAVKPDFGPDWSFRFQIQMMFPK